MTDTIRFSVRREVDDFPDISWLEQTDEEMGEGFEAYAQGRLEGLRRLQWWMEGVIVELQVNVAGTWLALDSASLWGIESDSGDEYFQSIADDLRRELVSRIETVEHGAVYA